MAQITAKDLDLMDEALATESPFSSPDSFFQRNSQESNPAPNSAFPQDMDLGSRLQGRYPFGSSGNQDVPLPKAPIEQLDGKVPAPNLQQPAPLWPGPGILEPRQPAPQRQEPEPLPVAEGSPDSSNPFEVEYQNILKERNQQEFKDRGIFRGIASDVAGGLVDYGELGLRGVRTVVSKGSALEEAATSGIERIKRFKEETPFLQQDPNAGYLSRAFHGGIRSAVQSVSAGLPTAAAGFALGSTLGPFGAALGGVIGFAAGGATQFGLAQYDDVMERAQEAIKSGKAKPEEVQASAIRQGIYEGGFEFVSDLLEGWMMGAGKLLSAPAKEAARATVKDMTKVSLGDFLKRAAGVAAAETSTEMATQALESEEDYRLGIGNQRYWEGAIDAFGPSFVASIIFAGLGHANVKLSQRKLLKHLENPEADPNMRAAAAKEVYDTLKEYDPVVSEAWGKSASAAIRDKLPISTTEDLIAKPETEKEPERLALPPGQGFTMREPGEIYSPYSPEQGEALKRAETGLPSPEGVATEEIAPEVPIEQQIAQFETRIKNLGKMEKSIATQLGKATTEDRRAKLTQRLTDLQVQIQANVSQRDNLVERMKAETSVQVEEAGTGVPEISSEVIDRAANEAATSPKNELPEPTQAQKEAGNYKLGHVDFQGLDISIENQRGSTRKGISPEGKPWETELTHHYGYIRGTIGKDKDHIDSFIGPNVDSDKVFVVDQTDPKTGKFDEHKVMLGFNSEDEAKKGYLSNYDKGWKGLGGMTEMSMDEFKTWTKEGDTKKPVGEEKPTIEVPDDVVDAARSQFKDVATEDLKRLLAQTEKDQKARPFRIQEAKSRGEKNTAASILEEMKIAERHNEVLRTIIKEREESHDRQGEGGMAGPIGEGKESGGTVQESGAGREAIEAGGILQTPASGEKLTPEIPAEGGIAIETPTVREPRTPKGEQSGVSDQLNAGSAVQWIDRNGNEHTGIVQKWIGTTAAIRDEAGKTYAVKREKLTEVTGPSGTMTPKEAEKPSEVSIEPTQTTAEKPEEQAAAPISMEQESAKEPSVGQPKGAADQIQEMSMDEIDSLLDEGEKAAISTETGVSPEVEKIPPGEMTTEKEPKVPPAEKPAEIAIEAPAEGGPLTPKGPRQKPKRTASEIAKSAAEHGVKGIDETISGLYELFGGKAIKSLPGGIDEETYQKAKPHFQKALEEFQAAGKDIKAFVKWAYDSFSSKIKPYLRRFIQEMKGIKPGQTEQPEMEEEGGEGISIEVEGEEGAGKKKKRIKKLLDTGEKLGGKRSSKDHRERSEAIEIELDSDTSNIPPKALAEFLIKKTTRSNHLRVDHAIEGRTPGTARFLNVFRGLIATWPDSIKQERRWSNRRSMLESMEFFLSGGWSGEGAAAENQKSAKKSASEYISVLEQLNDAVSSAVTVGEARQNLLKLMIGEEKTDQWMIEDDRQLVIDSLRSALSSAEAPLTDTGKSLSKFLGRKWDFAHFMINGWETIAESELDETKDKPIVRQRRNIFEITTPDTYRNGRDIPPEELLETFGLRGLDFGEWVEADFRQRSVNLTYDSFKMLAEAIGGNDKGISLNDKMRLGIGWGARGRGGRTAAEFHPDNRVIALTKTKGDGSLAHEWAHAFDYMTERDNMTAATDTAVGYINAKNDIKLALNTFYNTADLENLVMDLLRGVWHQARSRVGRLQEAKKFLKQEAIDYIAKQTDFEHNAVRLDKGERGKYWSKPEEMFARAFEAYVSDKLQGSNTYLVDADFVAPGAVEAMFNREHGAYPSERERDRFNRIFDDFFSQVEWSEEGVPKLKSDYVPVTTLEKKRAQEAIDAMMDRIDKIYEALYGGEQSDDGLYWYAYEQTGRGVAAQPNGYIAYDDSYSIEASGDESITGTGAVAYTDKLKSDEVLVYFLRPIKYNETKSKITLEAPDGSITDMGYRGPEALEEAPPENVRAPGGEGTSGTGGPGRPGELEGGDLGPASGGSETGSGEGAGASEAGLPPVGGGGADTSSGQDALQSTRRIDYTIRNSRDLEQTNQTDRFNNNIAAIRTLKQIEAEGRLATEEEQAILVKYSGWGELSEALSRYPGDKWKGRAEIVASILTDEEIQGIRRSSLDAYYTAPTVAHSIYEGIQRLGFTGGKVLEPSCGVGHFFGTMPENIRRNSILTGIDIDSVSARITRQLYQNSNVINQPFEETTIPDNFYDLTISNVPFGEQQPYDPKHNPDNWPIHDYFINKMINITKPGGMIVAITSTGTMDKASIDARKNYSEKAELIGAFRLPNGIFPGALAGADILYFRKKGDGLIPIPNSGDWIGSTRRTMPVVKDDGTSREYDGTASVNNYFIEYPDNVIGTMAISINQYGGHRVHVVKQPDFQSKLTEAIDRLPTSIYSTSRIPSEINILDMIPEEGEIKDFNYYVGDDGNIYQNQGGNPKLMEDLTGDQATRIKKLIGLRGIIRNLLRAQASDRPAKELDVLRKKLREHYDAFVKNHGPINLRTNQRLMDMDPDAGLLYGLENWDKSTRTVKSLADIFTKNTVAKVTPPDSAENSEESLVYSLMWRGRVDLPYMSGLTGKMQDTLISELKGKIFDDPEKGYVTADEYLSGNVRHKLAASEAAAELDPKYRENVEALKIALPVNIPMSDIRAKLGASWIPADAVRRFVIDLFGGDLRGFYLDHVIQTGQWTPHFRGRTAAQARRYEDSAASHTVAANDYGVVDDRGRNRVNLFNTGRDRGLMDYALNGGFPKVEDEVRDPDGQVRKVVNIRLTDAANAKLDALHARFSSWVHEREDVSTELEKIYNERFNSFVERQYDGSHLVFPGKVPDEIIQLRPHQKNAIWRFLQSGVTYLAHEVGTGKTFTMIGSAMEARRMGLARKPVMVVKKATIEQIAASFLKLYPGANILVMKVPENAEKRKRVFSRIATGDYDCIIVNHDSFKRIPLSAETQREIINRELQNYERALYEAQANDASRHTLRDIERRIERLRQKLRELADMERDDIPSLEEMGIDMVLIDEAHTHKNIGFQTQYGDIKGVEPTSSEIAFDLFMKTQYLHDRMGRGILMASATPLTNSVGELFNISRYLHPRELERLGIATFDAWANSFGVMRREAEYAPEGGRFKLTSRFAEFVNVPELMVLARQHMDIRTAKDLNIPRPDLIGGKPEAVTVEQNEYARQFQAVLRERVRTVRREGRYANYRGTQDNMLRIVSDGRLVAMDPRLYDPNAPDYPDTKTNACVNKVWELYQKSVEATDLDPESKTYGKPYKEKNHLQLIFADRGVPKSREDRVNLYSDIKKKLVAKGIPAKQIAFIHDARTDDAKVELFRKAKAGEIRVLIGSTGLMGIGVNVQDRVSFLHHLDVDWTYANYEQRNGRGWRFGNRVNKIGIFNYGTKQTVDAFMWSTVAYKEKILQQVLSSDPKIRNIIDISKTSMEASEMEGLLADDPMHKEKIELKDKVRRLSNIKSEYEASRRRAKEKLARIPLEIEAAKKAVANNHLHLQISESITALEIGNIPGIIPREQGMLFDLDKEGAKANDTVKGLLSKTKFSEANPMATVGRFGKIVSEDVKVKEIDKKTGKEIEKTQKVKRFYPLAGTLMGKDGGGLNYRIGKDIKYDYNIENGIKRGLTNIQNGLLANIKEGTNKARLLAEEIPRLRKLVNTPWEHELELSEKERRLRQITEELLRRQDEEDTRARAGQDQTEGGEISIEESDRTGFSIGRIPVEGSRRDQIEAHISPIVSTWANAPEGGIRVLQAQSELPESIRNRARGRLVEGVYDPATKTIWMVADNLPSIDRAEEVLAHEAYVHHGLKTFLGEKKANAFLSEVALLYGKKGLQDIADRHGFDLTTKEGRLRAAEEKLAQMAETGERPGLLRRIYAAVRTALREIGFKLELSDADIAKLLTKTREWVEGREIYSLAEEDRVKISTMPKKPGKGEIATGTPPQPEGGLQVGQVIRFIRYGKPTEYSVDWSTNQPLKGMSVYSLNKDGSAQQTVRSEFADRKDVYVGTGRIVGFGSDGEPLVSEYKIRKATQLQDEKAYYGGISRQQWLKDHGYDEKGNKLSPSQFGPPIGGGPTSRQGASETESLSFLDRTPTDRNDPDILFSLSAKDLLNKVQTKLEGTPKSALRVMFGEDTDISEVGSSFRIPAWLAKISQTVDLLFNRQNQRDKDRAKIYHDFLRDVEGVFELNEKDREAFVKLAFGLENKKVVNPVKFVKTGTRDLIKGPGREIVTIPVYKLNEDHYRDLDKHLRKEKVSDTVREAYMAARRALDSGLLMIYDRLAEVRNIDPVLIEEYRNQMGRIENYFPHNRYGNWHIKAIDPKAKPGDETRYREHFNAVSERHARFWYAKNVDRIVSEMEKAHPEIKWRDLEWTVDRNRDLPEEVYDFPIPVDAMQMILDSAVSNMPEESGLKDKLRKELSLEVSNVLKSRGFGSHMIKRKDIPGFETQDAAKVLHDHFAGFAGWMTKMEAAHDFGRMLRNIDARMNPAEYKWATRFVHDMLENQTRTDRTVDALKAVFFMKYLGGNVKTMMVNLTQNLIAGVPRLAMDTGISGASRQFAKAVKDIRLAITEKGITGNERLSEDERRLLEDMFAEGWGQSRFVNEVRGQLGGRYKKVFSSAARLMGYPMEVSERYNRLSLGLAAFRAARAGEIRNDSVLNKLKLKQGVKADYATAKNFAETVVNDAHFIYGKGNRPQVFRGSAAGKMFSSAYTFRSFTHNMLSMWRWMLASGDKEGKKAFAYSLLAMISLGGLSAIPIYNTLAALIRELFGSDLLGNGVRKQLPPGMRDLVMYGGPALAGVNIGGSIGMELPVVDRMELNKNVSGQLGEAIGSLLGVPYSMFVDLTKAVDAVRAGRPDRAAENAAPVFVRNILAASRLHTEGQTSITGKPINVPGQIHPRKLTEGEAFAKGLGFQPVSATKAFEIYKTMEQLKSYRDEKQSELANRYVAAMRSDDRKEMVAVRNEAREWNREVVLERRPEMRIDLNDAIKARKKTRQPMKQMRGLGRELRESYGM